MTEQAPLSHEDGPQNPEYFQQLRAFLDAARDPTIETSDEDKEYLLSLASQVVAREEVTPGHTRGGVETPDSRRISYEMTLFYDDQSTAVVKMPNALGEDLKRYESEARSEAQPNETSEAAAEKARRVSGSTEAAQGTGTSSSNEQEASTTEIPKSVTPAPATTASTKPARKPSASTRRNGIAYLVKLDSNGRAHYESGVRLAKDADGNYLSADKTRVLGKLAGKFMTKYELDMIEANAGLIRNKLDERKAEYEANKAGNAAPTPPSSPEPVTPSTPEPPEKSDFEEYKDLVMNEDALTYSTIGDKKSGRASDRLIEKRRNDLLWQFKDRKFEYDSKTEKFIERNPKPERVTMRNRMVAKLGSVATRTVVKPFHEIAKQTREYTSVRSNYTPGIKHAVKAARYVKKANDNRERRQQFLRSNGAGRATVIQGNEADGPIQLARPEILERLEREAERRRTTRKRR